MGADNYKEVEGRADEAGADPSISSQPASVRVAAEFTPAPVVAFQDDIKEGTSVVATVLGLLCFPLSIFSCVCLDPKEEMVVLNYGIYTGTLTEPGIHFRNCMGRETRRITTAEIATDIPNIKVLDGNGNPILVSAILTYKFVNSKLALLNVVDPYQYVSQQATAVLKQVVSRFPYEFDDPQTPSLKNETEHIGKMLVEALQPRVAPAGAHIISMQLNELNYAPEIAAAMLKVQQAKAMIAAREHIVHGAVGIAKQAVSDLEEGGLVMTDTEKVKLVTNLLTVTCGDREAIPTVGV